VSKDATVARLRAAGCVFAEDEARLLISAAGSNADLEARVRRREAGEPLEVILGWAEFCGLRVAVAPGVFVPRQRSALLVELAASDLPAWRRPLVVDLCCGTGALGLALAARAEVELIAADLDPGAVGCARRNLAGAGQVFEGDLYDALPAASRGRADVVLANAPYVPTDEIALMPPEARLHEPRIALDGGVDGLSVHRRIAAGAGDWLAPGGRLLIEVAEDQVPAALQLISECGLRAAVHRDEELGAVAVMGTRPDR
jgi:release factor glutamine methyltransferase